MGGFSHWSEQKLQTGLLKMHIHSLPVVDYQMAVKKSAHK